MTKKPEPVLYNCRFPGADETYLFSPEVVSNYVKIGATIEVDPLYSSADMDAALAEIEQLAADIETSYSRDQYARKCCELMDAEIVKNNELLALIKELANALDLHLSSDIDPYGTHEHNKLIARARALEIT